MPMSALFPRPRRRTDSGYTLFEVLVVVFIIGLISAVAIPRLPVVSERVDYAMKRESFEQALNGLPYAAYRANQNLVLANAGDLEKLEKGIAADRPLMRSRSAANAVPALPHTYEKAPLTLPDGWVLETDKPIIYRPTGFCSGGRAILTVGPLEYVYDLQAPRCAVVAVR